MGGARRPVRPGTPRPSHLQAPPVPAFGGRTGASRADYSRLPPPRATYAGAHDHDDRWPDLTAAGSDERVASYARWQEELAAHDPAGLTPDERMDREVLLLELEAHRFGETRLQEHRWDPTWWAYLLGDGIFPLVSREFAPLAVRLTSVAGRLEAMAAVVVGDFASIYLAILYGLDPTPVEAIDAVKARLASVSDEDGAGGDDFFHYEFPESCAAKQRAEAPPGTAPTTARTIRRGTFRCHAGIMKSV